METKSRYEVISDLENKKRELINEREGLNDQLIAKQNNLKAGERKKEDTIREFDRQLVDIEDNIENYKNTMAERKETINELIKSVDDSLERFGKIASSK